MAVADRFRGALAEQQHVEVGETQVETIRVRLGDDANGDEALFLTVILSDPPKGHDTWPGEHIWELRRITRDIYAKTGLQIPIVISFTRKRGAGVPDESIGEVDIDL
jgi:hypothetical protein